MSTAMMMNPTQLPHRKPVPGQRSYNNLSPQAPQQQQAYRENNSRPTGSPNALNGSPGPGEGASPVYGAQPQQQQQQTHYPQSSRRTLSNATTSTTSTTGLQRAPTNSTMPRRSTSSRSNGSSASPTSYVALMRKQKATVWCDRAQQENPQVLATQRAAKMRAAVDIAGGSHHGSRISTSSNHVGAGGGLGLRSKIRHQGAPKANAYSGGANLSGAGVPLRLSALDDEGIEEDRYHRTGSGRSSVGSGSRSNSYVNAGPQYSNNSTPRSGHSPDENMGNLAEEETPVPNDYNMSQSDYFERPVPSADAEEQNFGNVSQLPPSKIKTIDQRKVEEDLRRRGSVDERNMTMTGQRLFVANPDLD